MQKVLINEWCREENLILLEGWARDGNTMGDIANRIGVDLSTLNRWRRDRKEINQALNQGKEIIDYKVENALLKSALGYKTKETTIRILLRNGVMVEEEKLTTTKEQAPNVSAIQCWLYNRQRDKWKNMNSRSNIVDELEEDTNIKITVTRAKQNELENNNDEEWEQEVNDSVEIRKANKKEIEENEKNKQKHKENAKNNKKTKIEMEPEDDLDYWPEDWSEDE